MTRKWELWCPGVKGLRVLMARAGHSAMIALNLNVDPGTGLLVACNCCVIGT